jgi:hypothetical protein
MSEVMMVLMLMIAVLCMVAGIVAGPIEGNATTGVAFLFFGFGYLGLAGVFA